MKVRVIIIAAVSADGFISKGEGVPWEMPEDRIHFRRLTSDQWMFLGRKTFDEMTGWFVKHRPLVLTQRKLPQPWENARVSGIEEAMRKVSEGGGGALWVCGGASAYEAAMACADEIILTEVSEFLGTGVAFPKMETGVWREVRREKPMKGGVPNFGWVWYERVRK